MIKSRKTIAFGENTGQGGTSGLAYRYLFFIIYRNKHSFKIAQTSVFSLTVILVNNAK